MPGEQLMCVWQAVCTQQKNGDSNFSMKVLKKVTAQIVKGSCPNYTDKKFDDYFSNDKVEFGNFKQFICKDIRQRGVPDYILFDAIEDACWEICGQTYKDTSIKTDELKKLWQIFNRLLLEGSYPPTICEGEVKLLYQKLRMGLRKDDSKKSLKKTKKDPKTFQEVMTTFEDMVKGCPYEVVQQSIENVHSWLVSEVIKSAWLQVRIKKHSNWTSWKKRRCILTSRKLMISKTCIAGEGTGKTYDVLINKDSKFEVLEDYRSWFDHLSGRFKISNKKLVEEVELATNDDSERRSWMSVLGELAACQKVNLTPVQQLIKDRHEELDKPSGKQDSIDASLDQTFLRTMTSKDLPTEELQREVERASMMSRQESICQSGEQCEKLNKEKLKALFFKMDKNRNGLVCRQDFSNFITELGLNMTEAETDLVFRTMDKDNSGFIKFEDFENYFCTYVLGENGTGKCVAALRAAFLAADRDGNGTINFKEFTEFIWEKKGSVRTAKLVNTFNKMDTSGTGEVTFPSFMKVCMQRSTSTVEMMPDKILQELEKVQERDPFEQQLKQTYDEVDGEDLSRFIRERWKMFATLRRTGLEGDVVMQGGHGMVADVLPGNYNLVDLVCFSDLPPLVPKHTVVKGVKWIPSSIPSKSGKIVFPDDFDGRIETETATSELLRYYDCNFAESDQQEKIFLMYRHGIQDFTYENSYLQDYIARKNGGSGIEKHDFSHLDCPLDEDSGIFILAKFEGDNELHITGFHIPVRHSLYIPGGCIHSNDYLKGTWRTMLSDETDIDHVHLVKQQNNGSDRQQYEHFMFSFTNGKTLHTVHTIV